jgi:hypothetical protein
MSKKSRRRNKRLLALAGLAGAVALSNRKAKADLASTEDGKSAKATPVPTGPKELGISTRAKNKPAITMPDNLSKNMGKNNAQQKIRFGQVIDKKGDVQTLKPFTNSGLNFGLSGKEAGPNAPQNQPKKERIPLFESPRNKAIRLSTASGKANAAAQAMMGGYKKGGRVKGCGIAKRGLGRAMKKGKR